MKRLFLIFVFGTSVISQAALAATYTLPADVGSSPFDCSGSGPSYNCNDNIDIGNNDDIVLTANITLNINGNLDIGNGLEVIDNGFTLNLNVNGNVDIGNNLIFSGNIDTNGNLDIGNGADFTGQIDANGNIDIGNNGSVIGDITSDGNLDIGNGTTVIGVCSPSSPRCTPGMTNPTVDPLTTSDTTPILTGTFTSSVATELTVTVNSVTYTLSSSAELTNSGDDWTLDLSSIAPLALGTYEVTATSDDGSIFLSDTSANELVIQAAGNNLILSTIDSETLGGLSFGNDDLAAYDQGTGTATLLFDGGNLFSNTNEDIDAMHYLSDGNLVISTNNGATLGGLTFEDGDLVLYNPVSDTAALYFDEDNFSGGADINAIFVRADGNLVLSTGNDENLGGLAFENEDLVLYDPIADSATLFLNGDTVFSDEENISGVHVLDNGNILLTTGNSATINGFTFEDGDVVEYNPGSNTATLYFDEDNFSGGADVNAISLQAPVTPTDPTPIAEYRLDETSWSGSSNDVVDSSGNGLNGIAVGGATAVPAQVCNGASLNASGQYIEINDDPLLDIASELTVTAWIQPNLIPSSGLKTIVSKDENFEFHINTSGQVNWWWGGGSRELTTTGSALTTGNWQHVAIVYSQSAGSASIYIDGVLRGSRSASGSLTLNNDPLLIGTDLNFRSRDFDGLIDEVRVYEDALNSSEINTVLAETRPCPAAPLDHIRIIHDGQGLTCLPESIEIQACENADCSILYTPDVSVDLTSPAAGWSSSSITVSNGSATVDLSNTSAGTVTLDATATSPTAANATQCLNSATNAQSCDLPFADAGFIFDVPDLTACKTSANVTIQAVRTDQTTQSCAPAFSGNRSVNFWSTYNLPASGTQPLQINGSGISGASPGSIIQLNFDSNAESTFTVTYDAAGQMTLNARYDGSVANNDAGLVLTNSDSFVSRPVGLAVYSPDASSTCDPADATCSIHRAAGAAFDLNVKAACWVSDTDTDFSDNPQTPNFELASIPITHNLIAPSGGDAGTILVNNFNMVAADGGIKTISQSVSEVGVFTFTASPPNYFTQAIASATSPNIGRFTPDRLEVSVNTPVFDPACSGNFTYFGQEFGYVSNPVVTITGINTSSTPTRNYDSSFWKLPSDLATRSYTKDSALLSATTLSPPTTVGSINVTDDNDLDGLRLYTISGERLTASKPLTPEAPVTPATTALIDLTVPAADLRDTDLVCYDPDDNGVCDDFEIADISGTELRYGRLALDNVFGSELIGLTLPMRAEYFDGSNFILNDLDGCTTVNPAVPGQLLVSPSPGSLSSTISITPTTAVAGVLDIDFTAPGASGFFDLTADLSAATGSDQEWLQFDWDTTAIGLENPTGRATFGIFSGDGRQIYYRQIYQ